MSTRISFGRFGYFRISSITHHHCGYIKKPSVADAVFAPISYHRKGPLASPWLSKLTPLGRFNLELANNPVMANVPTTFVRNIPLCPPGSGHPLCLFGVAISTYRLSLPSHLPIYIRWFLRRDTCTRRRHRRRSERIFLLILYYHH